MDDPQLDVVELLLTAQAYNADTERDADDLPPQYRRVFWKRADSDDEDETENDGSASDSGGSSGTQAQSRTRSQTQARTAVTTSGREIPRAGSSAVRA